MTARHLTLFALFILLCCGLGVATPPARVTYQQQELTPAYGPSYCQSDDLLKQILEEMKGLRKDVQSLKGGTGQQQDGAIGVIAAKCLSCHQDGPAQTKGGEFVLVEKDGALAELSLAEKRRIIKLTGQGKMPPDKPLTDAEKKLLADYFDPTKEQKKP